MGALEMSLEGGLVGVALHENNETVICRVDVAVVREAPGFGSGRLDHLPKRVAHDGDAVRVNAVLSDHSHRHGASRSAAAAADCPFWGRDSQRGKTPPFERTALRLRSQGHFPDRNLLATPGDLAAAGELKLPIAGATPWMKPSPG